MCGGGKPLEKKEQRKGLRNNLWYGGSLKGRKVPLYGDPNVCGFFRGKVWAPLISTSQQYGFGGDHNSCGCVPHLPSRLEKHGKSTLGLVGKRALTGDPGYILMFLCSYSTHFALHPTPPTPVTYEGDQRPFRHGKYGAPICYIHRPHT